MPLKATKPLTYLISSGATTSDTTPTSSAFSNILQLVEAAVNARIDLVQIREKQLKTRVLFELVYRAAGVCGGSSSRLLVNDRADVAVAAGANGVHLTSQSLGADVVRKAFGAELLIGVSTHIVEEVMNAKTVGADFVVFGPVYETGGKPGAGIEALRSAVNAASGLPVIALGGISIGQVSDCLGAGAAGVAAIRMFSDATKLREIVEQIREIEPDGR